MKRDPGCADDFRGYLCGFCIYTFLGYEAVVPGEDKKRASVLAIIIMFTKHRLPENAQLGISSLVAL